MTCKEIVDVRSDMENGTYYLDSCLLAECVIGSLDNKLAVQYCFRGQYAGCFTRYIG